MRAAEARRVARFVGALDDFEMVEDLALPYNHMGATITDGLETEDDLRVWLCSGSADPQWTAQCEANAARLLAVHGIGPKTVDYFKILCGEQDTAAIDMHLTAFIERAGVRVTSHEQARAVIGGAAAELGVPAAQFDHSIWTYMSKAGRTW